MEIVSTTTGIPQSVASNLTIFDEHDLHKKQVAMKHAVQWLENRLERAKGEDFSEITTITPEMATVLLQRNPGNRRLRKTLISAIRSDIAEGCFTYNGESIIVSRDGLLNDGQHRLIACRESGRAIRSNIVFGVQRSSRTTVDQGGARHVSDYMEMNGHSSGNSTLTAATARLIWMYTSYKDVRPLNLGRQPTKGAVLKIAEHHAAAISSAMTFAGPRKSHSFIGSTSLVAFCIFHFRKIDIDAAEDFFRALISGNNLDDDSPIQVLRRRFITDPEMRTSQRFEAIVRAWNAYRTGVKLSKIQIMGRSPKIAR